jgi:uncharacterized protein (UPF0276 family)
LDLRSGPEQKSAIAGVGLGLRWDFVEEVLEAPALGVAFFEVSPENYMRRGGYYPAALETIGERYPLVTHGLTLSLGAIDEPEAEYLSELRTEVRRLHSPWHSDHLCFSTAGDRVLHELLPLKFCMENVTRVADRIKRLQDTLGLPLLIENISYYAHPGRAELPESEFITRVLERSQSALLLDVNNVYVNAQNHGFDPHEFLREVPLERVVEIHVAGHSRFEDGTIIDTHGSSVCDPVLELLAWVLDRTGPLPVLLERDNDIPPLAALLEELEVIRTVYQRATSTFSPREIRRASGA